MGTSTCRDATFNGLGGLVWLGLFLHLSPSECKLNELCATELHPTRGTAQQQQAGLEESEA